MEIKKYIMPGLAVLLLLFCSCKKEADLSISQYPVVEAYLHPGREVRVRLTQQKGPTDTAAYGLPLDGMAVSVSDGATSRILTEDKPGIYLLKDSTFVKGSGVYSLRFDYQGKTVSATTVMPSKPELLSISATELAVADFVFGGPRPDELPTVKLSWSNPESKSHLVFFKYLEPAKVAINSFFTRDTLSNVEINAVQAGFIDVQQMNFRYLGRYRVVLARVNEEYTELLNGSGNSSQNLTNPPTNVKNGFGIFTAIQTDTLAVPFVIRRE
ncbi:MAG: DUF4249 family protein [Bacteroidota bacterium]